MEFNKSKRGFDIEIGVHTLTVYPSKCEDQYGSFYYCKQDNKAMEQIYCDRNFSDVTEEEWVEMYEEQNEILQ